MQIVLMSACTCLRACVHVCLCVCICVCVCTCVCIDEVVNRLLEHGGLQQVVTSMDSGYLSATVQEYGCRIIVNMSMSSM